MAQRALGVEAGVLAGGQVNADLHPGSLRSCGAGEGFSTSSRLSVALIYSIPCAALLSPKGFGSEEGACRFVIAHVFSSPQPFLLTHQFSRTLTFSSKDAVGRFAMARAACCTSCLPSLVAALENAKFLLFWWKFPRKSRSFLTSGSF